PGARALGRELERHRAAERFAEADDAFRRRSRRALAVVGGACIAIHAALARPPFAAAVAAVVVGEDGYAARLKRDQDLAAVRDVAAVAVRPDEDGCLLTARRRRRVPGVEPHAVLGRDAPLLHTARRVGDETVGKKD